MTVGDLIYFHKLESIAIKYNGVFRRVWYKSDSQKLEKNWLKMTVKNIIGKLEAGTLIVEVIDAIG